MRMTLSKVAGYVRAYESGESLSSCAARARISSHGMRDLLKGEGVEIRGRGGRKPGGMHRSVLQVPDDPHVGLAALILDQAQFDWAHVDAGHRPPYWSGADLGFASPREDLEAFFASEWFDDLCEIVGIGTEYAERMLKARTARIPVGSPV
jgi:hypothetical protein